MSTSIQSNRISYAIDIDTGTTETLSNIYMNDGHIRFVTDNYDPITTSATYEDTTDVDGVWEKDILKVDGIDDAGIQVDISYGGTYANLNGFSFTIFNMCGDNVTPYHKGIVNTVETYLVGSTLTLYVIIDDVFYKRWVGIVSDYAFTDEWFKFNADDASLKGFNLFPKQIISKSNYPNTLDTNIGQAVPVCVGLTKYAKLINVDTQDYVGFGNSYLVTRLRYNISTGENADNDSRYNNMFAYDDISQEASETIEKCHLFAVSYGNYNMGAVGNVNTITQDSYIADGNGYGILIVASESPAEFIGKWITFTLNSDVITDTTKYKYYKVVDAKPARSDSIAKTMVCLYVDEPINEITDEGNFFGKVTSRNFDEIVDEETLFVNVFESIPYNNIVSQDSVVIMNMFTEDAKIFSENGDYTFFKKGDKKIQKFNPTSVVVDNNRVYITDGIYDSFILPNSLKYAFDQSSTVKFDNMLWSSSESYKVLDKTFVFDDVSVDTQTDYPQNYGDLGIYRIENYTKPSTHASKSLTFGWKGRSWGTGVDGIDGIMFWSKYNASNFDPAEYDEIYPLVIGGGGVHDVCHYGYYNWKTVFNRSTYAGLSINPYGLSTSYFGNVLVTMGDGCDYRWAFETFYGNGMSYGPSDGATSSKTILYCRLPMVPTRIFRNQARNTSIYDILGITGDTFTGLPYAYVNNDPEPTGGPYDDEYEPSGTGYYVNTQNCGVVHEAFYRIVECSSNNKIYRITTNPQIDGVPNRAGEEDSSGSNVNYRSSSINGDNKHESCMLNSSIAQKFNQIDEKLWNNFDKNGNIDIVFQVEGFDYNNSNCKIPYTSIHKIGLLCRTSYDTNELYVRTIGETDNDNNSTDHLPKALRLILSKYNNIVADYTAVDTYRTDWTIGRYVTEQKNSFDYIKEICEQFWIVGYTTRDGTINFANLEPDVEYTELEFSFDDNNIVRDSINGFSLTPLTKVCNEIQVSYDFNEINQNYDKVYSVDLIEEDSFPTENPITPMYVTDSGITNKSILYMFDKAKTFIYEDKLEVGVTIAVGTKIRMYFTSIYGVPIAGGATVLVNSTINQTIWYIDYTITVADYIEDSRYGNGWDLTMIPFDYSLDVSVYSSTYTRLYLGYVGENCNIYYADPTYHWQNYVAGVDSYADAKIIWNTCKNAWYKSKTINQYPIKELSWVPDMNNFYQSTSYDESKQTAYLHFRKAIDWTTEQKYQVKFKVPITVDTTQIDLMLRCRFFDKLLTGNSGGLPEFFLGYVTKMVLKPYEYVYEMEMTGKIRYLTMPVCPLGDGDIIEDESNTNDIIERGGV